MEQKSEEPTLPLSLKLIGLCIIFQIAVITALNMNFAADGRGTLPASIVIGLLILQLLYLLPGILASSRKHIQLKAIWAVNLLLGWSIVGWVVALVWAITDQEKKQIVIVREPAPPAVSTPAPDLSYDQGEEQIIRLIALRDKGLITEEELAKKKAEILTRLNL